VSVPRLEKTPRVPGRLNNVIKWDDRFFDPLP